VISGKESADPELVWSLAWQYQRIMSMRDYREILSVTTMHLEATHHQMTGCKLVRAAAHGASDPSPSIMNSTDELLP
jgi:hypothetical protein